MENTTEPLSQLPDNASDIEVTGVELFKNEVSDELFGRKPVQEVEDAETLPETEVEEETEAVTPEAEPELPSEEDSDEDILAALADEENAEGEAEDSDEDKQVIADDSQKFTVKVDGEEVEVTLADLKRRYGHEEVYTKKSMKLAEDLKRLDEQQNAITHLQYQGEFAAPFHQLQNDKLALESAKDALADGKPFNEVSGDELAGQIKTAEVILQRREEKLQQEYLEKVNSVDAPGRKQLETRLPDIKDKFEEYSKTWHNVGKEFGFTDVELANNRDFRYFNLLQEIVDGRSAQEKLDSLKQRARNRGNKKEKVASKGTPPRAATGSSKKLDPAAPDFKNLAERVQEGDSLARMEAMAALREEGLFKRG